MFLRCSYFLAKSEADVLINSVLTKRKACKGGDAIFGRGKLLIFEHHCPCPIADDYCLVVYSSLQPCFHRLNPLETVRVLSSRHFCLIENEHVEEMNVISTVQFQLTEVRVIAGCV